MNHALVTGKMKTVGSGFTFNGHPYNSLYSAEIDGPFSLGEGGFVQVGNVSVTGMVEFHPAGDARISIYSESEQARLALGPQGGLHGCGLVQGGLLVNPGHVLADVPGKRLRLMNTVENAGAIKVANGSEVSLGGQLVGAAGSVIEAAGGLFVVENGDVTGTMEATGTGLTFRGWQMRNTLRNAHIDGRATVEPHGYMCVGNSTVTGMVEMVGPDSILRVPGDYGPNVFVLGGGLRGFGVVDGGGVLENRGEVSAEGAGRVLDFRGVTIRNKQMVGVRGGATLRLNAWLEGSEGSTIQVDEGAKFLVENGAITGKMKTTGTGPTFNGWLYNLLRLATIDGPCEVAETGLMNTYASTVNGFIKLNGPNSVLRLYDDPATSILTLGPDGGVRGGGVIDGGGTVDNRGTISADEGPIRFNIVRTLNRGEIAARNGNTVRLDHCVLEGVDGSLIQVDEGSTFLVEWATVTGRMRTTGTGLTFTWAYNHVIDAVIDGPVTIPDVAQMSNSDVTVNGNINLGGVQAYAGIHGGRRLKLGAGHDLRGFGIVNGDGVLENWGRVIADVPGQTLFVRCAAAENHGILTAIPNATLEVSCPVMQNGTLDVPAGSTVRLNHGLTQSLGEVVVNGTLDIPGWSLTLQGGTLDGAGTINGPVVLEGGRLGSGAAGLLSVHGDYTQGAGATLGVVLGGEAPGASDERLHVTQRATLGGTLLVGVPAGFHPEDGSAYTILRYGSRVGAFDQVVVQDPSGSAQGYSFDVIYNGQDVQLKAVASQAVSAAVVSNSESVAASGESAPPAV
jgi:hypothetical protein